jgi:uncharacterized membrane protein YfcA
LSFGCELSIASLIAAIVGFLGGYTGIAGGPFIVFLLSVLLGYSQHAAQGTVLAMMLGPMTILPVIAGWNIVGKRWKEILVATLAYMLFSLGGAEIAYLFSSPVLKLVFGAFIIVLGLAYILFSVSRLSPITDRSNKNVPLILMALIGAFIGTVGGMVGIGAGILLIPILTIGLGIERLEAQTISLAILLPPVSIGAVAKYGFLENDIIWPAAGLMLLAYIITAGLGYRFSLRHRALVVQVVLSVLLVLAGVISITQGVGMYIRSVAIRW